MKKIIFILLVLTLLILSGCAKKEALQDTQETTSDKQGYVTDIDTQLDTSDINSLDEDLNLDWV